MSYATKKSRMQGSRRATTKARKTFSLSKEILEFLEAVRKHQKADSLTAALEMILREEKQRRELKELNSTISQYYDSLSNEEVAEQRNWGEFTAKHLWRRK